MAELVEEDTLRRQMCKGAPGGREQFGRKPPLKPGAQGLSLSPEAAAPEAVGGWDYHTTSGPRFGLIINPKPRPWL